MTQIVPASAISNIRNLAPRFLEDPRNHLFELFGRNYIRRRLAAHLQNCSIKFFHGTRLSQADLESVKRSGLLPLNLADRRQGLIEILKKHPLWDDVSVGFDDALQMYGRKHTLGSRENGCVYACFSRSALLKGCTHYLQNGAEVDDFIGHHLFGNASADEFFNRYRSPYIISFDLSFAEAARYSTSFQEQETGEDIIVDKLLCYWAYSLTTPDFEVGSQGDCIAIKIRGSIAPDRLDIEAVNDVDIG